MDKKVLDWLLAGPAWLKYAVELQLLNAHPDVAPVFQDAAIQKVVARLRDKDVGIPALKSGKVHYTESGKAYWDLFFLADIGFSVSDLGLEKEAAEIFKYQSADGSFTIPPNVRDNYFCMSSILLSSLTKMGYRRDPRLEKYTRLLISSQSYGGGWHCYDDEFGRVEIGACPMANLNALMLLGQYETYRRSPAFKSAIDLLLQHWRIRANLHSFGVGRRFTSLQYPAVKYGILRVLDALSLFPYAIKSPDFQNMLDYVHNKALDGRYYAESFDSTYAGFDFAQDMQPSRWITFLVARIDKRVED